MKRILVTSTDLMMIQFLVPHVKNLAEHGYEVEIACSEVGDRMVDVHRELEDYVKDIHVVRTVRNPAKITRNMQGLNDLKEVIENGNYDLIWTNEPVMGVCTRLAAKKARKRGTKVIYMVHGFHFYKGASKLNWMTFYPVEKKMASYCDAVVTIVDEDYELAKEKFSCSIERIHGIGVSTERYDTLGDINLEEVRANDGLKEDDFVILCIGELNDNKNQKLLIEAANLVKDEIPQLKVLFAGKGDNEIAMINLIEKYGLSEQVKLLGYRKDLNVLTHAVDTVCSCSYREGLPFNIMEAMLCRKPVLASYNRGHNELVEDGVTGYQFSPEDAEGLSAYILKLHVEKEHAKELGENGFKKVQEYTFTQVSDEIIKLVEKYS